MESLLLLEDPINISEKKQNKHYSEGQLKFSYETFKNMKEMIH